LLYDRYIHQDAIKFILTGSGFLNLHQLVAESLAGRVELFYLREFGIREIMLLQNADIKLPRAAMLSMLANHFSEQVLMNTAKKLRPFREKLQQALHTQIIWGGLPEVLLKTETSDRRRYLSNYLQTYLERDIRAIENIADINLYQRLMKISAEQTGSIHDDKKIIEALGCARNTLKKYRGVLQATLQYQEIFPFIGNSVKRLVKSPKGYLTNNGLISYLTELETLPVLKSSTHIGYRFENWFLNELLIWLDNETKHHEIYFWRTCSGVEVDFVVTLGQDIYAFEIIYSNAIDKKKVRQLLTFMNDEPNTRLGVYIYNGELQFDIEKNILFLPAWLVG